MFGKIFKSLFSKPEVQIEPVEFDGYFVTPILEDSGGGRYYTSAKISKEINGEMKETMFIRADSHTSIDQAQEHSLIKAKQIIKEQGDTMFNQSRV